MNLSKFKHVINELNLLIELNSNEELDNKFYDESDEHYKLLSRDNEYSILDYHLSFLPMYLGRKLDYSEAIIYWINISRQFHYHLFTKKVRFRHGSLNYIVNRELRIFRKRMRNILLFNSELYPLDEASIKIMNSYSSHDDKIQDIEVDNNFLFRFNREGINKILNLGGIKVCTRSKDLIKRYIKQFPLD